MQGRVACRLTLGYQPGLCAFGTGALRHAEPRADSKQSCPAALGETHGVRLGGSTNGVSMANARCRTICRVPSWNKNREGVGLEHLLLEERVADSVVLAFDEEHGA